MMVVKKRITEDKEIRATALVKQHPLWTRIRVEKQLRKEFGTGLRYEAFGKLRGEILSAGAVGELRRRKLLKEGFLPTEAKMLSGVAITSELMRKYIADRKRLLKLSQELGMSKKSINDQIRFQYKAEGFYKKGKIQPLKKMVEWTKKTYSLEEAVVVGRLGAGAEKRLLPKPRLRIKKIWIAAGFLREEADEFLRATNWEKLPFTSPGRAARRERTRWINDLTDRGWTKRQIIRAIEAYIHKPGQSPWDFIRRYKIRVKKDFVTYAKASQDRAKLLEERTGRFYRSTRARVR